MKKLELKNTDMILEIGSDKKGTYLDLIKLCLQATPKGGFGIEDMAMRLKIREKAQKAFDVVGSNELQLEDAEADSLNSYVNNCPWGIIHEDILQFAEDVKNMETVTDG